MKNISPGDLRSWKNVLYLVLEIKDKNTISVMISSVKQPNDFNMFSGVIKLWDKASCKNDKLIMKIS